MSEDRKPYLRMQRSGKYAIKMDIFYRISGTSTPGIEVGTHALEKAIEFLTAVPAGCNAFLTLPSLKDVEEKLAENDE